MSLLHIDFIERLRVNKEKLSSTDEEIATYITEHIDEIPGERLGTLSEKVNVSNATLTRFAQKLGFSGFMEMRHSLVNPALKNNLMHTKQSFNILQKQYEDVLKDYTQLLSAFIATCDFDKVQEVAELMHEANRIILLGLGNSGFTADELNSKLSYIGINSSSTNDSHGIRIAARHSTQEDVVIFFSRTGTSRCIVDGLQMAKENNTPSVLITTNLDYEVRESATYCFVLPGRELFLTQKVLSNQLPQLFIADILYSELFKLDEEKYEAKQKLTQSINL